MNEENSIKKQSASKGFAILSAATLLGKVLSLLYVPFLIHILGKDGYGVYNSTYVIFIFIYVITNSGISVAISKAVSEFISLGNYKDAVKSFKIARLMLLILGMIMACFAFIFAVPLAKITHSERSAIAIMAITPTIIITPMLSAYRGFFQGRGNMVPTAVSQLLEQFINVIFSLVFAYIFMKKGVEYGAAGGTIGTTLGALVAAIYLSYTYKKTKSFKIPKTDVNKKVVRYSNKALLRKILNYAVPIAVCVGLQQAGNVIDLSTVKSRLLVSGYNQVQTDALWGVLSQYNTLLGVPIAIISSLAVTVLPAISSSAAIRDKSALQSKINYSIRICFMIAIPSAIGLAVLAKPILMLIHYDINTARLLAYGAIVLVFMSIMQIQTAILQGVGKSYLITLYAALGLLGKIVTNYIFVAIPSINILGAIMGYGVNFLIPLILNHLTINKVLRINIDLYGHAIKPAISSIFMGSIAVLVYLGFDFGFSYINIPQISNALAVAVAIVTAIMAYFYSMVYLGGITKRDLDIFPARIRAVIPVSLKEKMRK